MRDDSDDSTPRDARDADHIWLRQSVTFSVNGRTRTLEMALPLRPGATPDEVDALLDEADAGMRRLSQRLDAHLAELAEVSPPPTAPTAPIRPDARPSAAPTTPPSPAQTPAQAPTRRSTPTPAAAPTVAPAAKAAPASGVPDLSRPEFLAALRGMNLDVRSAMERLGVRSLDGLNLREALDLLDRQAVRDGDASPASPAAPTPGVSTAARVSDERAAALAAMPAPIGRADAARFEEEDDGPDFELSYPDPEDLPDHDEELADEDFAPETVAPAAAPLADVPDLDELLGATAPATSRSAQSAPKSAEAQSEDEPAEEPQVARARAVIAELRAAHTGGQPTGQQRSAYQHVVVSELGETKAAGVIRAVWSLTPEKLGSEQYDALIRWGKLDTFGDEVEAVLELLRAEYRAAQQRNAAERATPAEQAATPAAPPATSAATPTAPRRPSQSAPAEQPPAARPAPRGRSSSARSQAGSQAGSQGGA